MPELTIENAADQVNAAIATLADSPSETKEGRGIVIADVTIVLPATNLVAVQTADGFVMQASLVMVAIDNRGNRSEVPAMPLAFITASKPPPESLIRYKTRLKLRNRTTKLAVALHDTVGGETFARVVTEE